jgi:uncharacterized protein (TIGR02271 family)
MTEMTEAYTWLGRNMLDSSGEKLGKIDEIYEDERTGKPEWALVHTGPFGTKSHFVPLAGASPRGEDVAVNATKDQVKDAPSVEAGGELYVVTEQVTQTVPVQREEVRIEREPITDENRGQALDGPEISEEEHEVVLHEERPVVQKETVAKERVRLGTDVVTDEHEVSEEIRKERIETDAPEDRAS